jgi:hypothetical protein
MPGEYAAAAFMGVTKQGKASIDDHLTSALSGSASTDAMLELGGRGKATAKTSKSKTSASAEFDLSGFTGLALRNKSEAEIQHALLGHVKGDLLTLFKLGAEGNLSGKAEAALTGLKAQLLADAFLGAKLDVTGNAEFGNDLVALALKGEIHGTAGVSGNVGLSAALGKDGFEAALKAGAFAGAKIEFKGSSTLKVGKRPWGTIGGSVSFRAGAGGDVEAAVKLNGSGFTVKFGASSTVGVGMGTATFHTTKILGYENLDIQMADNLKALDDVLWVVNQQLGVLEKRQGAIEKGSETVSLL